MGVLDDAVSEANNAVPGGDFTKPLMIAAGALILGHLFGGKHDQAPAAPAIRTRSRNNRPRAAAVCSASSADARKPHRRRLGWRNARQSRQQPGRRRLGRRGGGNSRFRRPGFAR